MGGDYSGLPSIGKTCEFTFYPKQKTFNPNEQESWSLWGRLEALNDEEEFEDPNRYISRDYSLRF
jgi:hypothetical protein